MLHRRKPLRSRIKFFNIQNCVPFKITQLKSERNWNFHKNSLRAVHASNKDSYEIWRWKEKLNFLAPKCTSCYVSYTVLRFLTADRQESDLSLLAPSILKIYVEMYNSYNSFYFLVFVAQNERKKVNIFVVRWERQTAGNKLKHAFILWDCWQAFLMLITLFSKFRHEM